MEWSLVISREQWQQIDSVLLDMDGTLLDLAFDNHFWQQYIPKLYSEHHQIPLSDVQLKLSQMYKHHQGTLNWYCTDFWSQQLGLDVINHKSKMSDAIAIRHGSIAFLNFCYPL